MRVFLIIFYFLFMSISIISAEEVQKDNSWWWNDDWWKSGKLETSETYPVSGRWINVRNGDIEIPALIVRPDNTKKYPAVLFVHGRRGLDPIIKLLVRRLAARGFVVLAPDLFIGRFIAPMPIEHDPVLEQDLNLALDQLLKLPDISSRKACLYSHTRGGYLALRVAVTLNRQTKDVACYLSYYPHMQNPNAPEPMQVYRYAPEADELKIPVLIFIGENEQYQRKRGIEMAVTSLREKKRDARLIVYPGVGRGFDFRDSDVRTFADDLASKDAIIRATHFLRKHLKD
jgi:carboxymethylenebutenolidase